MPKSRSQSPVLMMLEDDNPLKRRYRFVVRKWDLHMFPSYLGPKERRQLASVLQRLEGVAYAAVKLETDERFSDELPAWAPAFMASDDHRSSGHAIRIAYHTVVVVIDLDAEWDDIEPLIKRAIGHFIKPHNEQKVQELNPHGTKLRAVSD